MTILTIDKDNAVSSMQKILKLVSSWKRLEIIIKEEKSKIDINKSYENALKEYNDWKITTRFIKQI